MRNWTSTDVRLLELRRAARDPAHAAKAQAKADATSHKKLMATIINWLHLQGVKATVCSRMDRKTTQAKGVADILFSLRGRSVAWEIKVPPDTLSRDQIEWRDEATEDGWAYSVLRSLDDAIHYYEAVKSRRL